MYATTTSKDEKAQPAKLDIEGLRGIARIVRAIKARIEATRRDANTILPANPSGDASTGPMGGQDHHGKGSEK